MIGRFGSREICDVTFKTITANQKFGNKALKKGQVAFVIDTATASNMEQQSNTVYAQGGKGYSRLIAWEGEKTMTFTVTDALMSPIGLKMLTGAGLSDDKEAVKHVHMTFDVQLNDKAEGEISADQIRAELGLQSSTEVNICGDDAIPMYATILDDNGAVIDWVDAIGTITPAAGANGLRKITDKLAFKAGTGEGEGFVADVANYANKVIKLDFYVAFEGKGIVNHITVGPEDFGGYFYVEADTLYRDQNGKDMAATITFPKVKIQSGFTIAMAANGDPSTFDFVMDAFPAYTYFDQTKKVMCDITIVNDVTSGDSDNVHVSPTYTENKYIHAGKTSTVGEP